MIYFSEQFKKTLGRPILYNGKELVMVDFVFLVEKSTKLKITFISADKKYRQGIELRTKGEFEFDGQKFKNRIRFWQNSDPKDFFLSINSKDKTLTVHNIWQHKSGTGTVYAWWHGAAMMVEVVQNGRIYNCNDGYPDDDLNDLIFKIEILPS